MFFMSILLRRIQLFILGNFDVPISLPTYFTFTNRSSKILKFMRSFELLQECTYVYLIYLYVKRKTDNLIICPAHAVLFQLKHINTVIFNNV